SSATCGPSRRVMRSNKAWPWPMPKIRRSLSRAKKWKRREADWSKRARVILPSVISSGFADKRQTQTSTRLREEDYNASVRALENVYTGGAVSNQVGIAELIVEKQRCELEEVRNKVAMDVRVGFNDVLLNRAKVRVRENSVRVLDEELKTQEERLRAGIVGTLNVRRDRKSTRLNSSHVKISYAVFCLKKKK